MPTSTPRGRGGASASRAAGPSGSGGRTVRANPGTPSNTTGGAAANRTAKAPAKAGGKAAGKAPVKATAKTPAKTSGKAPAKTSGKAPAKTSGRTPAKTPAKGQPSGRRRSSAKDLTGAAEAARTVAKARPSQPDGTLPATFAQGQAAGVGPTGRKLPRLPEPKPLRRHGPARILAMCNQKGGVGKTTSTINLGASLAEYGRRVLLVDFDPQGALSVGLGVNPLQLDLTVYNLLMDREVSVHEVLLTTDVEGLDLLPSNIDLSAAEVQLVNEVAREQTLARVLEPVLGDYDVVLVDCQPSLGLLTVNALTAAHAVIIPLECEFFALRGVALLIQTIEKIRERLNPSLELEGILATMYDARTLHGREVLARVVEAFGDRVFHTVINRTIRFPETTVAGEPITTYASSSSGAQAYRDLAKELLAR
jgi:chromosome partitioning protein